MTVTFPSEACAFACRLHARRVYCWRDHSKTIRKWKTFARTLLPF